MMKEKKLQLSKILWPQTVSFNRLKNIITEQNIDNDNKTGKQNKAVCSNRTLKVAKIKISKTVLDPVRFAVNKYRWEEITKNNTIYEEKQCRKKCMFIKLRTYLIIIFFINIFSIYVFMPNCCYLDCQVRFKEKKMSRYLTSIQLNIRFIYISLYQYTFTLFT